MKTSVFLGALTVAGLAAAAASAATLDDVKARGKLICGVNTGLTGFAAPDANGVWHGFDVAVCRAVAAAIFSDPNAVEFTPTTGQTRFTALASGEVDMLVRNSTWTYLARHRPQARFRRRQLLRRSGLHGAEGAGRDLGQGTRRRHRLHPDRHHDRAEPGRLLPGQQHQVRAGPGRERRHGAAAVSWPAPATSSPPTPPALPRPAPPSSIPKTT